MGYRSEVEYLIHDATNTGKLKDYISYLVLLNDEHVNEVLNEIEVSPDFNYIRYSADSVKWYEHYEDVSAHIKMYKFDFNYFKESSVSFVSMYVRIGEDINDIEWESFNTLGEDTNPFNKELINNGEGSLYEMLGISRSITRDYNNIEFNSFKKND